MPVWRNPGKIDGANSLVPREATGGKTVWLSKGLSPAKSGTGGNSHKSQFLEGEGCHSGMGRAGCSLFPATQGG